MLSLWEVRDLKVTEEPEDPCVYLMLIPVHVFTEWNYTPPALFKLIS